MSHWISRNASFQGQPFSRTAHGYQPHRKNSFFVSREQSVNHAQPKVEHSSTVSERDQFIIMAESTPIQEFDPRPIQKKCSSRAWPNDIVFQCDWIVGGPCNVRQEIFACIRWAMESGAGLVLPKIYPRVSSNSSEKVLNKWGKPVGM